MFVLSGILLLAANLAARYSANPVRVTLGWAAAVTILPVFVMVVFPVVWIQAGVLLFALVICSAVGARSRWISVSSVASVVIAYCWLAADANAETRKYDQLRAQYPFESMADRLPRPTPTSDRVDHDRLDQLERAVAEQSNGFRVRALARLHADAVTRFARTPGLGVGRMGSLIEPSEWNLKLEPRGEVQQQEVNYFRPSLPSTDKWPARPDQATIDRLHQGGVLDFVNPQGFGYVKDRQHVAGFQPHGFSQPPESVGTWKVATVDLVGLLLHDTPVVYVSAKLPKMDELRDAPTRPLDAFETTALAALRGGADMHTADATDGVRFVGALRNARQCAECHGGERGALLGAFSYRLQPSR